MMFRLFTFLFGLAAALPAQEIPTEWDVTVEVNQLDPTANDQDATTPFKTIQAAADNALGFARAGRNVRVLIHPGIYRESVELTGKPDEAEGWIKFEGTEPGKVVLNGADVVKGWSVNDDSVFERPWSRGKEKLQQAMDGPAMVNPMVFVEGARMLEVDSVDQVRSGRVYFGPDKIYLVPPKGGVVSDGKVEIARPLRHGFKFAGLNAVYLENLSIERGYKHGLSSNNPNEEPLSGDEFTGIHGLLVINNVSVEYCRGIGLDIWHANLVRLRRVFVERCGWGGIGVIRCEQVAITGSEVNLNGWAKLAEYDTYGHEVEHPVGLGIKECLNVKLWSLRTAENNGSGLWLEQEGGQASLGKVTAAKNKGAGILARNHECNDRSFWKTASTGNSPIEDAKVSISESEMVYNGKIGLGLDGKVTALVNTLYGNGAQVVLGPQSNLTRNLVVAEAGQVLVDTKIETVHFTAQQNLYDSPSGKGFVFGRADSIKDSLTFAQWQEETGQDLNSYFGDPKLLDPKNYQFAPTPTSPWFDMKNWPVRELN